MASSGRVGGCEAGGDFKPADASIHLVIALYQEPLQLGLGAFGALALLLGLLALLLGLMLQLLGLLALLLDLMLQLLGLFLRAFGLFLRLGRFLLSLCGLFFRFVSAVVLQYAEHHSETS